MSKLGAVVQAMADVGRNLRQDGWRATLTGIGGRRVLGEMYTLEQWNEFAAALKWHMQYPAMVIEEKLQLPGTGHEGPPVYEYTYRLATPAEKEKYK